MVCHGNRGKRAGNRKVRKSGSMCLKLPDGSVCINILAESAKTRRSYIIFQTDHLMSCGLEAERSRCFWIQMIMHRNCILAVNNDSVNCK